MSGSALMDALMNPGVDALAGMAQGFAQAAMPSRMPVPFGAAIGLGAGGALQGAGASQKLQSGVQALQAAKLQNQVAASAAPMEIARNQAMTGLWNNPQGMMSTIYGNGGSPFGAPGVAPSPATPSVPAPSASAPQQPSDVGKATAQALASLPDDKTRTMAINAALSSGLPQEAWAPWIAANHTESGWDLAAPDNKNKNGTIDVGPGQVNSSNFGALGLTEDQARDPATNLRASAQIFKQKWAGGQGDPSKALAGYNAGSVNASDPAYVNPGITRLAGWGYPGATAPGGGASGGSGGGVTAQNAQAMSDQYVAAANDLERRQGAAKMFGLPPPPGDPAALRTAAQQYRGLALAGPTAGAAANAEIPAKTYLAQTAPYDLRPGGLHVNPLDGSVLKNPELREVTGPNGEKTLAHINPASPFAPPGTPGESSPVLSPSGSPAIAALPPDVVEGRDELTKGLFGKDTDSFVAANNTQGWLNQINHAADVMNKAGTIYQTGPYAEARVGLMNNINDVARTLDLKTPFDQTTLASPEELRKATTTAGFELSSHYEGHARQAAATIMNATSAVPGMSNSPQGITLVSNGINEGAQSAIDMHNYKIARFAGQDPYGIGSPESKGSRSGAGLESAEADFVKAFPAQMYSNRAISTATPFKITATDQAGAMTQMSKYLPGTVVILPNGKQTMVLPRPGAPPIPNYMHGYIQGASNAP